MVAKFLMKISRRIGPTQSVKPKTAKVSSGRWLNVDFDRSKQVQNLDPKLRMVHYEQPGNEEKEG